MLGALDQGLQVGPLAWNTSELRWLDWQAMSKMPAWKDFTGILNRQRMDFEKVILYGSEKQDLRVVRAKWETIVGMLSMLRQVKERYDKEEALIRGQPGGFTV